MPLNNIALSLGANPLSNNLQSTLNTLASQYYRLVKIKANMDNLTDGVSFTALESTYGIPTGKGQTVYNLVAGSVAELAADVNTMNLLSWIATTF